MINISFFDVSFGVRVGRSIWACPRGMSSTIMVLHLPRPLESIIEDVRSAYDFKNAE